MIESGDYISREAAIDAISEWLMKALHPENMSSYNEGERAAYRTAISEIAELPAADVRPRWIPVTERLPETGVDVLVKFPQNMAVASIDIGEWVVNSGDGWCTDINLAGGEKNPTHWVPLPEPPEEK